MSDINFSQMRNRITFYEVEKEGPEVGNNELKEIYSCYCGETRTLAKDTPSLEEPIIKNSITITIRNEYRVFKPQLLQKFKIRDGYYAGDLFEIKKVEPYSKNKNYLIVVGEEVA